MKRVVVPAALAVIVLICAGAALWIARVQNVAAAMVTQARLAGDLLDANAPLTESLVRTLLQPGLRIVAVDRDSGTVIDATESNVITHQRPYGAPVQLPPPGAPPADNPPPPNGPPNGPPPLAGPPPPRRQAAGPIASLAASSAHLAPIRVTRGDRTIDIGLDEAALGRWFALDVLGTLAGIALVIGVATWRGIDRSRNERRALEAKIAERDEAARHYQRFLAETGHELRTPLTVMMGYVDILRARSDDGPLDRRILDGMHAEAVRMRGLVEKMMTLARLESQVAVPRLLDIGTAAREAVQTVQRRYPDRDVRVLAERSASIVIDADDFSAALGNLLENAITYAPHSPIVVATAVTGERATVTVTDRGPGISPEDREAIFNRFYRGRGRELGEGLGLGLAIVRRVADRWKGTVDCTSGDGRTEFCLSFPLADEERNAVAR